MLSASVQMHMIQMHAEYDTEPKNKKTKQKKAKKSSKVSKLP